MAKLFYWKGQIESHDYSKNKKCSYCYIFFLVPKVGLYNPRRKNNPQDYFCLRFGRPQTSTKLGNLLFESHNLIKIKKCSYCYIFLLVPKVGLEPTWFPARFWVVCVCQFRHSGIFVYFMRNFFLILNILNILTQI